MSKISRRIFVKRTGASSLGAALGLGLIPSLTRKLHAEDTSAPPPPPPVPGVLVLWTTNQINDSWTVGGGTLTLSITQSASAPLNTCTGVLRITVVRAATYLKTIGAKTYVGNHSITDHYYWRCESGVPRVFHSNGYFSPTGQSSVAIANVNDPNDTIGNLKVSGWTSDDDKTSDATARVMDGVGNVLGEYLLTSISYEVLCCFI
jgi:hypothetical protein